MIVTPAEQQAVCDISTQLAATTCDHMFCLADPDDQNYHPRRPTLSNLWRFVGICARCDAEPATPETTQRLRDELGEDLAEGLM